MYCSNCQTREIKIKKSDLYQAVDRASVLNNEDGNYSIRIKIKNDEIIISSTILEIGKVKEVIKIDSKLKEEIDINLTSKYLLEALKVTTEEYIKLFYNGQLEPIIIRNCDDDSLTNLISLIRTV